jgi:hypothetical protein
VGRMQAQIDSRLDMLFALGTTEVETKVGVLFCAVLCSMLCL